MSHTPSSGQDLPPQVTLDEFNLHSGSALERAIFNHRRWVLALCLLVSLVLGWGAATRLDFNASYERMMPQGHPFIVNYQEYREELRGLGNVLRIVVENTEGDIFDPGYQAKLREINDELFLTPGVDRVWLKSLWTPSVRWTEVTEEGFRGGPVMPQSYDGSAQAGEQLRLNIARAGIIGRLVGADFRSSMILVPLLDKDPASGQAIDYRALSQALESKVRQRFEASDGKGPQLRIHMVGFAKVVGDLIDGLYQVLGYFLISAAIATAILLWHTRCLRSTLLVIGASLVAVLWQLGIVGWLGYGLDPFSILVPFLIFAIGVSHGAQKMNGIMQDIGRGAHRLVAARHTFRRLFIAGLTALLADAVGFAVLMAIDIPVIRDLTLTASIGVAALIFTNLILLPVLLSYVGVSRGAAARSLHAERAGQTGWLDGLSRFTERRWASAALLVAGLLTLGGFVLSLQLQTGDLEAGAPELRADSRYNRDNAYVGAHYSLSSDQFAVIVKTPPDACASYRTLVEADRLAWALRQTEGVQMTAFLGDTVRQITAGSNEGNPKWLTLSRNQDVLNYGAQQASVLTPDLFNNDCSVMPVIAYLQDHRAATLEGVVAVADRFARAHPGSDTQFLLAAGNAGIEAATNSVVEAASHSMLLYVYGAVILLCFVTFRDWRAVVVAVLPLVMTSVLCEALMVLLGIGVKVATLPVIALGVGIGVDYALYLLSIQLARQHAGETLAEAYRGSLRFTGKVVALVGVTLAASVVTWAWSPIKFQADMGILLTFMLLWNMLGALVLIPALSHFLLRRVGTRPAQNPS
ncbi:MAG TPA: MMPL family transporter [Rhodocyclaceae bacterium]|nr:MMPL family transporter [Rhodocyclaceae bacterium]